MINQKFETMKELFLNLGPEALTLNHYELTKTTNYGTPMLWKEFLMEPEIKQHIKTETEIIRNAELNKMTTDLKGSRSVGQAQLISALTKLNDNESVAEGPVFIYTYVPLSSEQAQAENVQEAESDPFWRRG